MTVFYWNIHHHPTGCVCIQWLLFQVDFQFIWFNFYAWKLLNEALQASFTAPSKHFTKGKHGSIFHTISTLLARACYLYSLHFAYVALSHSIAITWQNTLDTSLLFEMTNCIRFWNLVAVKRRPTDRPFVWIRIPSYRYHILNKHMLMYCRDTKSIPFIGWYLPHSKMIIIERSYVLK